MVASAHTLPNRPWFGQHGPVVIAPRVAPVVVAPAAPVVIDPVAPAVAAPCDAHLRVGVDRLFYPHHDERYPHHDERRELEGWRR
jgi:hypothetical protein